MHLVVDGRRLSVLAKEIVVSAKGTRTVWILLRTRKPEPLRRLHRERLAAAAELKGGAHTLQLVLSCKKSDRHWSGTLRSNELTIRIGAPSVQPLP